VPVRARLLGRAGTPLNVPVVTTTRSDVSRVLVVADVTLAPLAQGEYELELTLQFDAGPEVVAYRFGLVP
jgi:hypothetical protein